MCELHFRPEDVKAFDKIMMPDNSVHVSYLEKRRLKNGAIPMRFDGENIPV